MKIANPQEAMTPPERGDVHAALDVFLGEWRAEGWSFGHPAQDATEPRARGDRWTSTHNARWHSGGFFLIQDEKATSGPDGPKPFDTISIMGVDPATGRYFVRSFENHGFHRLYEMDRDGDAWTLTGATERARIVFSEGGRRQALQWEWLKDGQWLPLCDRVAVRTD